MVRLLLLNLSKAMRVCSKFNLLLNMLIGMFVFYLMASNALANDQSDKTNKDDTVELQVVIPLGDDKAPIADKDIRSKLLSEKLIKMGRAKSQSCTRCHGRTGMAALANSVDWEQSVAEFVVKQLTELREGKRIHAVMSSIAAPLSDQEIALIAAWYQSVSPDSEND